MKWSNITLHLSQTVLLVGLALLVPVILCLSWQEGSTLAPLLPAAFAIVGGLALTRLARRLGASEQPLNFHEGVLFVVGSWLVVTLIGAVPFWLGQTSVPFTDCWFESVSGFTTTGASVIPRVEDLPRYLLFWRSLTQWIGGLGIVLTAVILFPSLHLLGTLQSLEPHADVPHLVEGHRKRAWRLARVYTGITVIQLLILMLLGMNWFDAMCHSFGTVSTGGFSSRNASIGAFASPYIRWAICFFMLVGATDFRTHTRLASLDFRAVFRDIQLRFHLLLLLCSFLIAFFFLSWDAGERASVAAGDAAFQVVSSGTATGFTAAEYGHWPFRAQYILVVLMVVGGAAGSTAGGLKISRVILVVKYLVREVRTLVQPHRVARIRVAGSLVDEADIRRVLCFVALYVAGLALVPLVLVEEGLDLSSAIGASVSTLGGVGPGLGAVAPPSTYAGLTLLQKLTLILGMFYGRLEVFPLLILLLPSFWRRR